MLAAHAWLSTPLHESLDGCMLVPLNCNLWQPCLSIAKTAQLQQGFWPLTKAASAQSRHLCAGTSPHF